MPEKNQDVNSLSTWVSLADAVTLAVQNINQKRSQSGAVAQNKGGDQ
jgi:hypothetical protein